MTRGCSPARRRTSDARRGNRDVLRRREALNWRRTGGSAAEVRSLVVCSVLLFVGGEIAEVRLHRRDVRLVLGAGKFRNRDRGQNADDHDYDQKLD